MFSTLDVAGLATTDTLYLVSSGGHTQPQYTYLLHLSDATLRRVLMFSEPTGIISYGQMSEIEITPNAIFISTDNHLHVYGNYFIIYLCLLLMSFEQT